MGLSVLKLLLGQGRRQGRTAKTCLDLQWNFENLTNFLNRWSTGSHFEH